MGHGVGECLFCNHQASEAVYIEHVESKEVVLLHMCKECAKYFLLDHDPKQLN
jgi:transcription elongation factor Elf1